jgi:hypothetical protein
MTHGWKCAEKSLFRCDKKGQCDILSQIEGGSF